MQPERLELQAFFLGIISIMKKMLVLSSLVFLKCEATTIVDCMSALSDSHQAIALGISGNQNVGITVNSENPYIYRSNNNVELIAYPAEPEGPLSAGVGFSATNPAILICHPSMVVQKFFYEDIGIYYNDHLTNSFEVYCHFNQYFIEPDYQKYILNFH